MTLLDEEEPPIARDDVTPKLEEQARLNGWKAGIFNFGKAESPEVAHFNPGLVRRPDGLWLLVRRSELAEGMPYGRNGIWACKLEADKKPVGGPLLKFPDSEEAEQFEDPRAIYWNGQTWVAAVNFTWFQNGSWTGAHQMLGVFRDDEEWTAVARRDPPVGTNKGSAGHTDGLHNKNFTWFFHDGKLHLIYTSDPWLVIEFGTHWEEQINHVGEGVKWKYGHVRGGTPPVLVGDLFYTFFHSSMPWRGRFRRYFMGCLAFEAKPPFRPVLWTQEPMLTGSQNDPWEQRKPLVVFPCGAVMENERWLISYGINDLKSGWVEIPHEDVVKLVSPVPIAPAALLLAEATPKRLLADLVKHNLSGGVEKSHETRWQAGKDRPEATPSQHDGSPMRRVSGSDVSPRQSCGGSVPPAQNTESELYKQRVAAMTKARAILAEKRAKGLVKFKKRKRRVKRSQRSAVK